MPARRAHRPRTRSCTGSPTSGSATSASASRSPRCPAASGSGSSWPPAWGTRPPAGDRRGSTCSTSRPAGLHLADVEQLLGLLDRLVDSGKSVIVIEHHQAVMAHADWIVDLGPGAGHDGGRVVFEGTPADLVADAQHGHRRAPRGLRRRLKRGFSSARRVHADVMKDVLPRSQLQDGPEAGVDLLHGLTGHLPDVLDEPPPQHSLERDRRRPPPWLDGDGEKLAGVAPPGCAARTPPGATRRR